MHTGVKTSKSSNSNIKMLTHIMFRLLPIQVLLNAVGAINGIVSSLFATNSVGELAMSAVALYNPLFLLVSSISMLILGGSVILCGVYMGKNETEKMHNVFSLDLILCAAVSVLFIVIFLVIGIFGLYGIFTNDPEVGPLFCDYLLGETIGIFPFIMGGNLAGFLSLENKVSRTTIASLIYIGVNILLNFLFVQVLHMQAFGLALASSLGMWVFFLVQAQYFLSGKSFLKFRRSHINWRECADIVKIGLPGALTNAYQTIRGLIVNAVVLAYVGNLGLSAFGVCNSLLGLFWAIPAGMQSVCRMLISVSVGEEDRQTLTDIMRVMIRRYIPLMCIISAALILCAPAFTSLFYHNPADLVFSMTVWGFRLLPVCMPLAIFAMGFITYNQTIKRQVIVHSASILDGFVFVSGFTAILVPLIGMNGVYFANIINGALLILLYIVYAWFKKRKFPKTMDELMVIPQDFGVREEDRIDISVRDIKQVVSISEKVQTFCIEKGIDERRSFFASLYLEEMAGNVVEHGFTKDKKRHSVDIRVSIKDDTVILRVRDDCVPFDPKARAQIDQEKNIEKDIGITMIIKLASDVSYQNILGMNVLTVVI